MRIRRGLLTLPVVTLAGFLLAETAARADMPAVNEYWAQVDAVADAAKVFPGEEAAAFKTRLAQAVVENGRPKAGLAPNFKQVSEYDFFGAIEALIRPHVAKAEGKHVKAFLRAVSDGKWVQGHLIARNGGDFVTILDLVKGQHGAQVFRQTNKAVSPGDWKGTTFDRVLGP